MKANKDTKQTADTGKIKITKGKRVRTLTEGSKTRMRHSGITGALILVITALTIIINMFVALGETSLGLKLDLTANKIFTLNPLSQNVLQNLQSKLIIYSFADNGQQNPLIKNTLERYAAATGKLEVRVEDPARNPVLARKFSSEDTMVTANTLVVCKPDEKVFRVIQSDQMYQTNNDTGVTYWVLEQRLTSAVMYLSSEQQQNVYLLTGHGEAPDDPSRADAVAAIRQRLEEQNYNVGTMNLAQNAASLKKGDVLLVLGPTSDLLPEERTQFISFLKAHGKAVLLLDPQSSPENLKNFTSVLDYYLIRVESNPIYEQNASMRTEKSGFELVPKLQESDITSGILAENAPVYMDNACAVSYYGPARDDLTVSTLMTTGNSSVAVPAADLQGDAYLQKLSQYTPQSYSLGICYSLSDSSSVLADAQTRIVVLGSSLTATGSRMNASGNLSLLKNSVNWVSNLQDQLFIRGVKMQTYELTLSSYTLSYALVLVVIVVVPVAALACGFVVWRRRKNL